MDATNIFIACTPDFPVDDLLGESGSEIVSRLTLSARVVKAFDALLVQDAASIFAGLDTGA